MNRLVKIRNITKNLWRRLNVSNPCRYFPFNLGSLQTPQFADHKNKGIRPNIQLFMKMVCSFPKNLFFKIILELRFLNNVFLPIIQSYVRLASVTSQMSQCTKPRWQKFTNIYTQDLTNIPVFVQQRPQDLWNWTPRIEICCST